MVFKEYPYVRPDIDAEKKKILECCRALENAATGEDAVAAVFEMDKLERNVDTESTLVQIRYTLDTTDEFYSKEQDFIDEAMPVLQELSTRFSKAVLASPHKDAIEKRFGRQYITKAELAVKTMSEELIPLMQKENKLTSEYNQLSSSLLVTFDGEECNAYGLMKHMDSPDRDTRRRAYLVWANWFAENEEKLGALYDELVRIRAEKGKLMGYDTFTPLGYLNMGRTSYGPEDVARYRDAVVKYIVPVCTKLRRRQAKRIGVDSLKFYDEGFMFTSGNAVPQHPMNELVEAAKKMYHELSSETGEFFDFMTEHELLELETKPNKALGGYCTYMPNFKSPFIFSNSNGTMEDIGTLTHEAGHAFEVYSADRTQPLLDYLWSTSEVDEIHSMSMEYLTYPWMKNFFGDQTDKYFFAHMSEALTFIPYGCCVDEYQHIVYENPSLTPAERTHAWHELEKKYLPDRDYDGVDVFERGGFWMQKLHIFTDPFYYIDYTLASMGAFEFYGKSLVDRDAAWHDYLTLCKAGGSLPYRELLKLANLSDPFAEGTVERAIKPLVDKLDSIDDSKM